ncbi:hypothetical protein BKA70DRAFT_1225036 [Coprinopsis sp. MPI-PUGE-AT-0042]|nr:hypothetical protein BKA70DRAFT_1225036 [Coprinopsis sp. MPI-PUGE-AT-0042]
MLVLNVRCDLGGAIASGVELYLPFGGTPISFRSRSKGRWRGSNSEEAFPPYGLGVVDLKGDHPIYRGHDFYQLFLDGGAAPSGFRNVARLRCSDVYLDTRSMNGETKNTEALSGTLQTWFISGGNGPEYEARSSGSRSRSIHRRVTLKQIHDARTQVPATKKSLNFVIRDILLSLFLYTLASRIVPGPMVTLVGTSAMHQQKLSSKVYFGARIVVPKFGECWSVLPCKLVNNTIGYLLHSPKHDGRGNVSCWDQPFQSKSPLFKPRQRWSIILSNIGIGTMAGIPFLAGKEFFLWYYLPPYLLTNHCNGLLTSTTLTPPSPTNRRNEWDLPSGSSRYAFARHLLGWMGRFFFHNISHDHVAHHNGPEITNAFGPC